MRIIISRPALADLQDIFDYIAVDSPQSARKYIAGLHRKIASLRRFPRIYPLRNDLIPPLRSAVFGSHLILFQGWGARD
ncbi:MAG: type II toxin-antitoxin system RelE/ParE family toxin [Alphaproteobacteria bacterium]|nr:type II toxin-antitoxin system RelE/ParE family toxin [Alphaproteobacteria bacterium]MBL6938728.1 type II toxin-antitoxin system RelE/ParE family toxin [Alphaproteobacteria bacterium]MBL7097915.1 type II toxin-antitoxin system RelE/ParE family toxin [Alphaproteobacteria bacterium]